MADIFSSILVYFNNLVSNFFIKFIIAVIIFLIGVVIGRTAEKVLKRILHEVELNKNLKKAGIKLPLEKIITNFVKYFIYFIAAIWALTELGLTTTVLNMISAVVLVLILISLILGVKDFIPNIIAGYFIHRKQMLKQGDKIAVQNLKGKIEKITLTETEIKTEKGDTIYIPNSVIKKEVIIKRK